MTILNRFTNNSVKTLTDAPVIEINAEDAPHYQVTITANRTLGNPSNPTFAKDLWIAIAQDVVGGHTLAFQSDWVAIDTTTALNLGTGAISVLHATARNFGSGVKWYYSIDSTNAISGGSGSVAVPNIASLATTAGTGANSTATVLGFYTANDNGGGQFYWVPSGAATPLTGMVVNAPGGQWVRLSTGDNTKNVRWFGAKGDGVADDTVAIQTAINSCVSGFGGVFLPAGRYRITASLRCGWTINNIFGITFKGECEAAAPLEGRTVIIWDSDNTTDTAIWFHGYCYTFEGIRVEAAKGRDLFCAFELGNPTPTHTFNSASQWKSCSVQGVTSRVIESSTTGIVRTGFALGKHNGETSNLENCVFDGCLMLNLSEVGLHIASGQPYNTHVDHCYFYWAVDGTPTGDGVRISGVTGSGSLSVTNTDFQNVEVACYINGTNMQVVFSEGEYEHCKKVLVALFGGTNNLMTNMVFKDARCNNSSVGLATASFAADDYDMFTSYGGAHLAIEGIVMDDNSLPVYVHASYGSTVTSTRNVWSYNDPFKVDSLSVNGARTGGIWSFGDKNLLSAPQPAGSQTYPLASRWGGMNIPHSGPDTTMSDATKDIPISLPYQEWTLDYKVTIEVESIVGTPPAGALVAYIDSKNGQSFWIHSLAAPGTGNSVVWRYTTWR